MLGNLFKECGVVPKLAETAGNALLYIVTILLGLTVGATATAENFLSIETLKIFGLGILAFILATAGGVLIGKIMCYATHGKVNPMIGAAGVSAVPMAARVVQKEAQREDPSNFLLMQAMGPNVAGVIGSAVAAGLLIQLFGV
jgi:oxaloacetate decarboxylase beta subunit